MQTFIIRLLNNELSCSLAKDAHTSAHNFEFANPTYFDAIDKENVIDFLKCNAIELANSQNKYWNLGTMGCFASHWKLWNNCVEKQEPIIVLEHDGIAIRKIPAHIIDQIEDVCHLDAFLPFNSNFDPNSEEYFNIYNTAVNSHKLETIIAYPVNKFYGDTGVIGYSFQGAYGYLLTPKGANKLINFVNKYGAFPADKTICQNAVFLQRTTCSFVRLHPFFRSLNTQRAFTTRTP